MSSFDYDAEQHLRCAFDLFLSPMCNVDLYALYVDVLLFLKFLHKTRGRIVVVAANLAS